MVFLKEFFGKVDFEKNQQTTKSMKKRVNMEHNMGQHMRLGDFGTYSIYTKASNADVNSVAIGLNFYLSLYLLPPTPFE